MEVVSPERLILSFEMYIKQICAHNKRKVFGIMVELVQKT